MNDPASCLCGDAAIAHVRGKCAKCACTAFVPFHSTPDQDQRDDLIVRLLKKEA